MRALVMGLLALAWVPVAGAQQPATPGGGANPAPAADSVAAARARDGVDSLRVAPEAAVRAAQGAVAGAVVGAVLTRMDAECAPAASAARSSLLGGVWGALRAWLGGGPPAQRRGAHPVRDPAAGRGGPFPFDQDDCGTRLSPATPG